MGRRRPLHAASLAVRGVVKGQGSSAPLSPLYGIWDVTYLSIDGVERAPLPPPLGTFRFDRPSPERMTLSGQLDGRKIQMRLELFDRNKLLLVSRGFNWVQEYPFNR